MCWLSGQLFLIVAFSPRPARLRTETSYEADDSRRACLTTRSQFGNGAEVDEELGQG